MDALELLFQNAVIINSRVGFIFGIGGVVAGIHAVLDPVLIQMNFAYGGNSELIMQMVHPVGAKFLIFDFLVYHVHDLNKNIVSINLSYANHSQSMSYHESCLIEVVERAISAATNAASHRS